MRWLTGATLQVPQNMQDQDIVIQLMHIVDAEQERTGHMFDVNLFWKVSN